MSHTEGSEDIGDDDPEISTCENDQSQRTRSGTAATDTTSNISLPKPRQHVRCTSEDVEFIVELYRSQPGITYGDIQATLAARPGISGKRVPSKPTISRIINSDPRTLKAKMLHNSGPGSGLASAAGLPGHEPLSPAATTASWTASQSSVEEGEAGKEDPGSTASQEGQGNQVPSSAAMSVSTETASALPGSGFFSDIAAMSAGESARLSDAGRGEMLSVAPGHAGVGSSAVFSSAGSLRVPAPGLSVSQPASISGQVSASSAVSRTLPPQQTSFTPSQTQAPPAANMVPVPGAPGASSSCQPQNPSLLVAAVAQPAFSVPGKAPPPYPGARGMAPPGQTGGTAQTHHQPAQTAQTRVPVAAPRPGQPTPQTRVEVLVVDDDDDVQVLSGQDKARTPCRPAPSRRVNAPQPVPQRNAQQRQPPQRPQNLQQQHLQPTRQQQQQHFQQQQQQFQQQQNFQQQQQQRQAPRVLEREADARRTPLDKAKLRIQEILQEMDFQDLRSLDSWLKRISILKDVSGKVVVLDPQSREGLGPALASAITASAAQPPRKVQSPEVVSSSVELGMASPPPQGNPYTRLPGGDDHQRSSFSDPPYGSHPSGHSTASYAQRPAIRRGSAQVGGNVQHAAPTPRRQSGPPPTSPEERGQSRGVSNPTSAAGLTSWSNQGYGYGSVRIVPNNVPREEAIDVDKEDLKGVEKRRSSGTGQEADGDVSKKLRISNVVGDAHTIHSSL